LSKPIKDLAAERKLDENALRQQLEPARQKLLAKRNERPRPLTDTKILTGWNGLTIRGLADAGRIFENPAYTKSASDAAEFVLTKSRDPNGALLRNYAGGKAAIPGYLDDYAYFIDGLIALHQATGDERWLKLADELSMKQIELFWDDRAGGFFYTSTLHETLIARSKLPNDGVTPSGTAVSVTNLLYLAKALDRPEYAERAEAALKSAAPVLEEYPASAPQLAVGVVQWLSRAAKDQPAPPAK
jgi:uncharacterized protein YyaL (SSP411 family)